MPIRILVVDDNPLIRATLTETFDAQPDMEVVGEAGDGAHAVQLARTLSPDAVVMDVRMPRMDGLAALRRIVGDGIPCRVLILASGDVELYQRAAEGAGAVGAVDKAAPVADLLGAVRMAGGGLQRVRAFELRCPPRRPPPRRP
jgi:DNA-binding NarL/FixJ family response regulator